MIVTKEQSRLIKQKLKEMEVKDPIGYVLKVNNDGTINVRFSPEAADVVFDVLYPEWAEMPRIK